MGLFRKEKNDVVVIRGQKFTQQQFTYLLNSFKESFSQASLSIEKAFAELDDLTLRLESNRNDLSCGFYNCLENDEKKEITNIVHQIVVYLGMKAGSITETITRGQDEQKQIDDLYKKYYSYFDKYIYYYLVFDEKGNFDKSGTYANISRNLFSVLPAVKIAYDKAYNMKKDNLNAWDYAMGIEGDITIDDTIKINSIVNDSDVDKVIGFKRTNNDILSANFTPTDKTLVYPEMERLFAEYDDDFGATILDPTDENISTEERTRRCYEIYRREALFHIRFERIHPFNDGNGRTGRIILNYNLLKNHMPPVLITGVMSDDYKKFINEFDVDGLAKYLMSSSSQLLTSWIGLVKSGLKVSKSSLNPSNENLAKIGDEESQPNVLRKIKNFPNFLIFF
jgi:hypothetical protein